MAQLVQMRTPPASTRKPPSVCLAPARLVICAVAMAMALLSLAIASHVVGLGIRSASPIRQLVCVYAGLLFISAAWDILQLGRQTLASDE